MSFHMFFFFFKQKTAYEMRISDWSSDVCSSDLGAGCQPVLKFVPVVGENDGPLGLGRLRRLVSLKRRGERERLGLVLRGAFRFGGRSVIRGRHDEPTGRFFADKRIDEIGRASCRERVCQYV